MRLLLDCTDTLHRGIATGIQRVVRNLVSRADSVGAELGLDCQPVYLRNDRWWLLSSPLSAPAPRTQPPLYPGKLRSAAQVGWQELRKGYRIGRDALARMLPIPAVRRFLLAPAHEFGLTRILQSLLTPGRVFHARGEGAPLVPQPGDVLVTLDVSVFPGYWDAVARLCAGGMPQITVLYDMIPISHPQLCSANLVPGYVRWFHGLLQNADAVLAISAATSDALRTYVADHPDLRRGRPLARDWFHLGADLDRNYAAETIRPHIREQFAPGAPPTYLCVGTLEPNKNPTFVLNAFERLWSQGRQVRLCLIGNDGWQVDNLLERIAAHPQRGRLLMRLSGLNDAELDLAYRSARGLVIASVIEGFGLPLVEALSRGLPAFASDIPVFREIAGGHAFYFDLGSPAALADQILAFEQGRLHGPAAPFTWMDWDTAARVFVAKARALAEQVSRARTS